MDSQIFSSGEQRRRFWRHLFVGLLLIVLAFIVIAPYRDMLQDPRAVRRLVDRSGSIAPIAFIALQIVQTIVVPIPGQVVGIAGGYLFGAVNGTLYTMCGVLLGSYAAFWLARRFGRGYITAIFSAAVIDRYDATISKLGVGGLTILVLIPGLPDDIICFVCGTSKLPARQFLLIVLLGRTPAYTLAVLSGAEFGDQQVYRGLALALLLASFTVLGYLERDRLSEVVTDWFGA